MTSTHTVDPAAFVITQGVPAHLSIGDALEVEDDLAKLNEVEQIIVTRDPEREPGLYAGQASWRGVVVLVVRDQANADQLMSKMADGGGVIVPAPLLPCPSWCELDYGHGWDRVERMGDEDGPVTERDHTAHVLTEPGTVTLIRTDAYALDQVDGRPRERVRFASRMIVDGIGEDGQGCITAPQARRIGDALRAAARLMDRAHGEGDPAAGYGDDQAAEIRASVSAGR